MQIVPIILEQSLLHLPLMVGAYISFSLLKVPDLSLETAYVVGAIAGAHMALYTTALPAAVALVCVIIASVCAGALVGAVSSVLTQYGNFPHLLSCIVTFGLFHGINQYVSPSYVSLSGMCNLLAAFPYVPRHPELVMLIGIGAAVCILFSALFYTQLGYAYAVYGNNPHFFSNYGISTPYVFISGIMIANGCAGLSGYLFAQSNNFVELNMAVGKALLCITALIMGKAVAHSKVPFTIKIPIIGTVSYFTLQQLLLKCGFNLTYFTALQSVVVMMLLLHQYRNAGRTTAIDNLGI